MVAEVEGRTPFGFGQLLWKLQILRKVRPLFNQIIIWIEKNCHFYFYASRSFLWISEFQMSWVTWLKSIRIYIRWPPMTLSLICTEQARFLLLVQIDSCFHEPVVSSKNKELLPSSSESCPLVVKNQIPLPKCNF